MADDDSLSASERRRIPLEQRVAGSYQGLLPANDRGVIPDSEYSSLGQRWIDRSKRQFFWQSVSRVFNMIAAVLIPAAIGLVTGGLVQAGELSSAMITTVSIIGGIAAVSLAIGIGTDYFENLIHRRQDLDITDLSSKRAATHMARAFDEVGKIAETKPPEESLAARFRPSSQSWEDKTRNDPQAISQSIN